MHLNLSACVCEKGYALASSDRTEMAQGGRLDAYVWVGLACYLHVCCSIVQFLLVLP